MCLIREHKTEMKLPSLFDKSRIKIIPSLHEVALGILHDVEAGVEKANLTTIISKPFLLSLKYIYSKHIRLKNFI